MERDVLGAGAGPKTRPALAAFVVLAASYAMATIVLIHLLRPDDDPLASPISQYAVGRFGDFMTAALLVWGLAGWALAAALSRRPSAPAPSRVALGLWIAFGAGLVLASFVPVDVPYDMWHMSPTGKVHVFGASVSTFTAPIAALLVTDRSARRSRALAWVLLATMPTVFLSAMFFPGVFGLAQKIYALLVLTWMVLMARSLMRTA